MRRAVISLAGAIGFVILLTPMVLLWENLAGIVLSTSPTVLTERGTQQAVSAPRADSHEIVLVMKNPQILGGARASTDALGYPHFLAEPGEIEEPWHANVDCAPWVLNSSTDASGADASGADASRADTSAPPETDSGTISTHQFNDWWQQLLQWTGQGRLQGILLSSFVWWGLTTIALAIGWLMAMPMDKSLKLSRL